MEEKTPQNKNVLSVPFPVSFTMTISKNENKGKK